MKKDWEVKKLGEVCTIQLGKTPYRNNSKFWDKEKISGNVWLSISDLKHGEYISESAEQISDLGAKNVVKIPQGTMLISFKLTLGRISFAGCDLYTNEAIASLLNLSNKLIKEYLFYYFSFFDWDKATEGDIKVKGKTLNKKKLNDLIIPIPPLTEQKHIVSVLDKCFTAANKAKANTEQNLKNAKELFESYLQGMFLKKGKDWEEKQLGDLCLLITKGSSPKWQGIKYVNKPGILFVTSENVGDRELLLETRKYVEEKFNIKDKKSILKKGDVLTNIVGASIGRTAIYNIDDVANINQAVCILRCNPKLILNTYLMNLLNSQILREIFHDNEVNTARANLSLSFFNKLSVPLPSLKVQQSIVNQLDTLKTQTQKLETVYNKKISDLDELKKSILQEAFRGKLSTEATIKLLRK